MIDFDSSPGGGGHFKKPFQSPAKAPFVLDTPTSELPYYLHQLNQKQKEAALITEGPLMVLAGAGSGKTRMLTSRICYLVEHLGVPAHQVLAVTFTNKAAKEMFARIEKSIPFGFRPEIGTFHSIGVKILRRESHLLPFEKPFTIYDDSDQLSVIKAVLKKMGVSDKTYPPKNFQAFINRAKCDALEFHEVEVSPHSPFQKYAVQVYEAYQQELIKASAIDFGEILTLTYRLLRGHEEVRAKYQQRFRYVHVDEYQDTNRAQYLFLAQLTQQKYGGHQNICVVGDEDQSIYAWRGADINNILNFEKDFTGASVVKLEQNYRSTKNIILSASHLIRNNRQRKDKYLWTDSATGEKISHFKLPDEGTEAEVVVSEIKRCVHDQGYDLNDIAIFYRTHAQSRQFEDVLRRDQVAYQIVGGLRFYDRKEIKDILSYFRVIINPADTVSLKRILNVPARGIGKSTIEKCDAFLLEHPEYTNFWSVLCDVKKINLTPKASKKITDFVKMIERLISNHGTVLLSELYHDLLDQTGYVNELKKDESVESQSRIENLEEFNSILQEHEEEVLTRLGKEKFENDEKAALLTEFLERVTLVNEPENPVDFSSVKMMSLHSSKGLEFPVVFLVGLEEGLFPSLRGEEGYADESVIEEERRLCYVGMTRAMKKLYMTHVVCRRLWGTFHYFQPARFFQEIPEDSIESFDLTLGTMGSRFKQSRFNRY